jgi:hypothetical protein
MKYYASWSKEFSTQNVRKHETKNRFVCVTRLQDCYICLHNFHFVSDCLSRGTSTGQQKWRRFCGMIREISPDINFINNSSRGTREREGQEVALLAGKKRLTSASHNRHLLILSRRVKTPSALPVAAT